MTELEEKVVRNLAPYLAYPIGSVQEQAEKIAQQIIPLVEAEVKAKLIAAIEGILVPSVIHIGDTVVKPDYQDGYREAIQAVLNLREWKE